MKPARGGLRLRGGSHGSPLGPLTLACALACAACGGGAKGRRSPLARPESTFGAPGLVALVSPRAEWVLEVDLARLRANAAVGGTVSSFADATDARARAELGLNPLADADQVVIASFPGSEGAGLLFLLRGTRLEGRRSERPDAIALDARTLVIGPVGPREEARALATGQGASLLDDATFVELRDAAVPDGAPGVSVRLTARLPFGRRIALASQLELDEAPSRLSLWGDVADDLVIVADADAERPAMAQKLARGLEERLGPALTSVAAGARLDVKTRGAAVRIVVEIGPRALASLARTFVPAGPRVPELAPRGEE